MTQKMQAGNEGAGEIGREKKHAGWRKARPPPAADAVAHLLSGRRAGFRSGFIASEKKNKNATLSVDKPRWLSCFRQQQYNEEALLLATLCRPAHVMGEADADDRGSNASESLLALAQRYCAPMLM